MMQTLALLLVIATSITFGVYIERAISSKAQADEIARLKATIKDQEEATQKKQAEIDYIWKLHLAQVASSRVMYKMLFGG